jgi:hypothetical protein
MTPFPSCSVGVLLVVAGCDGGRGAALNQLADSNRLSSDIRLEFNKATHATDRAVMADTDEASIASAHDAEDAVKHVESDVAELVPLLRSLGYPNEITAVEDFQRRFAAYRDLDGQILGLAVENTNLKAQRLSFGPARQAADDFAGALAAVPPAVTEKERCNTEGLVSKATLSIREIQVMQAPHIAEASDDTMTRMEKDMAARDGAAHDALKALSALGSAGSAAAIATATSALGRFDAASTELVKLSRRNSNVRSLELSLRSEPALSAACDDSLRKLQEGLAQEGSKATR